MENKKLDEFNDYIKYRKIAVIGLGVSNIPLLDYLHEKKAKVTVFDQRTIDNISKDVMDKITSYSFEFSLGWNIPPVRLRSACMSAAFSKMAFSSGEK